MNTFEVFVPPSVATANPTALLIAGNDWFAALKAGLQRLRIENPFCNQVLVDFYPDGSVEVSEGYAGGAFRISPIDPELAARSRPKRPSRPPFSPEALASYKGSSSSYYKSVRVEVPRVEELEEPLTLPHEGFGRFRSTDSRIARDRRATDEELTDLFEHIPGVDEIPNISAAMDFLLELALSKLPSELAAVFHADGADGDLTCATYRNLAARPPLLKQSVIPAGSGFIGFSAAEGIRIAANGISHCGIEASACGAFESKNLRSLLAAPMMTQGRAFGCFLLANPLGGEGYDERALSIAGYLAHQAAITMNARIIG